ncbi:hypothetical protein ACSBR2_010405 [Camellia fascicularis]
MVQSHSSNGLGKFSSHNVNVISMPQSGLFKSEIAKKKVIKSLKRYLVGYENDQLQIPLEISRIGFKQWEMLLWMKNEEALKSILDESPYYIGSKLIIIKKWHPVMTLTKNVFSSVPIWVKIFNVPLELWTEEGLSYIASFIGNLLYLDEFIQNHSQLTFARICIEIEATKEIPSKLITQAPSKLKQKWKAKEVIETKEEGKPSELVEVKKKKDKDVVNAHMDNFVPAPPPSSSNAFDILNTYVANEEVSFCADLNSVLNVNCSSLEVSNPLKDIPNEASKEEK